VTTHDHGARAPRSTRENGAGDGLGEASESSLESGPHEGSKKVDRKFAEKMATRIHVVQKENIRARESLENAVERTNRVT
jgi:hypothetical protein